MDPLIFGMLTLAFAALADGYASAPKGSKLQQMVDFMAQQAALIHQMNRRPTSYSSVIDFILDRGRHFPVRTLTKEQLAYLDKVMDRSGWAFELKGCFANTQYVMFFDSDNRLTYVEGYAFGQGPIPVHHAWLAIDGVPVEVTWRDFDRRPREDWDEAPPLIQPLADSAYFGVEYQRAELPNIFKRKTIYPVIDDWHHRWPELHKPRLRELPEPE